MYKMPIVIAFGHKAQNGKDTCAATIIEQRSNKYRIKRYAFADALKTEVNIAAIKAGGMFGLFTMMADKLPDWVKYEQNVDMLDPLCPLGKQRRLLQWWGCEYRRADDPFYWVKKVWLQMQEDMSKPNPPQIALITDMRFPNEFAWVRSEKDNRTVLVERLGYSSNAEGHKSEEPPAEPLDFHYIIQVQDGNLEELKKDALFVFDHIMEELDFEFPDLTTIPAEVSDEVEAG